MSIERTVEVTSRELGLIHQSLSEQMQNTHALLEKHIVQDDGRFKEINDILLDREHGLIFQVRDAKTIARWTCLLLRWFVIIAVPIIGSAIAYQYSQTVDLRQLQTETRALIVQMKNELAKKP